MTSVVVDPRLRARRIAVHRAEGRRRLRRLLLVVGLVVGVVGVVVLLRSPLLDLDQIEVSGADRTSRAAVLEASGVAPGTPLVEIDADVVATALTELPWVERAEVTRRWPGTLSIRLTERVPVAVVSAAGGFRLVDVGGHVLGEVEAPPSGVPVIPAGSLPAVGTRVTDDLRPRLLLSARVADVVPGSDGSAIQVVVEAGDLVAVIEGVGRLRFGSLGRLDAKLLAAATVLEQLGGGPAGERDLREPSAVVRRAEPRASTDGPPGATVLPATIDPSDQLTS